MVPLTHHHALAVWAGASSGESGHTSTSNVLSAASSGVTPAAVEPAPPASKMTRGSNSAACSSPATGVLRGVRMARGAAVASCVRTTDACARKVVASEAERIGRPDALAAASGARTGRPGASSAASGARTGISNAASGGDSGDSLARSQ